MRRLAVKSKKGKADASDSEGTHEDEVECKDDVAASEPESASDEDVKVKSKRKSRHGKKKGNNTGSVDGGTESKKRKGNNTGSEDGGTESKKRKRNVPVDEKAEAVEYEVGEHNGHFCTENFYNGVHILYPKDLSKRLRYSAIIRSKFIGLMYNCTCIVLPCCDCWTPEVNAGKIDNLAEKRNGLKGPNLIDDV
jgi:hypothetical protein